MPHLNKRSQGIERNREMGPKQRNKRKLQKLTPPQKNVIYVLPNNEFKIMIIKKLDQLRENTHN